MAAFWYDTSDLTGPPLSDDMARAAEAETGGPPEVTELAPDFGAFVRGLLVTPEV